MEETSGDPWKYEQIELGFNYRITDLQACLGISQMKRLPLFIDKRRQLAQRYSQLLSDLPLIAPWQHPECASSWHLYVVQVDATSTHVTRREVFDYLKTHQIYPQVHYIPVHTQPWYRRLGFKHGQFPVSESYYSQTITLPLYYELSDEEQMRVVTALSRLFQGSRP
jgi:dTDP-4-amino-4,6-dideoxygalactose transaminase